VNGESATINVATIEELTLHSLDCTAQGLDELAEECRQCADALAARPALALPALRALVEKLHGFDVFRGDVMTLFQIAPGAIWDASGDLGACEQDLRASLDRMPKLLASQDTPGLTQLLRTELPGALVRFRALVPPLRDFIAREYGGKE
jgi:hypothetical protein